MADQRPLGLNVVVNALTAGILIATALVSVPLILGAVGLAGYGIWTLAQTLIMWATTAEAGLGPAIQRFVAVEHGGGDQDAVARLLWSTCLAYAAAGLALAAAAWLLAPTFVDLFNVPGGLREDAVDMFRIAAGVLWLALLVSGLGNVQQGVERYTAAAVTAAAGSMAFLAAVVAVLAAGLGLTGLALAAALQQLVMLAGRVADLRAWLRPGAGLAARGQVKELGSFSLRLQLVALSGIVNAQTDRVVVGLVSTPAVLGQLGIGSQVAEAGRLLSGAALAPMISRLSLLHGSGDAEGFLALFRRLQRLWFLLVIGGTVIGAAVLYPLIAGWLGPGHGQAAVFGGALVVAYGLNLLTGTSVAYLRALGRPSVEARYGAVLVVLNVVLTAALGLAFGAYGVVAATTVAYALGVAWFFRAFRRAAETPAGRVPGAVLARAGLAAVGFGALACAWGLLMLELLPAPVSMAGVGLGAAAAIAAYLNLVAGVVPTPAGLRRFVLGGA